MGGVGGTSLIKQISGRRLTAVDSTGLARLDYSRLVPATGGQGGGLSEGRMAAQRVLAGQDLRQSFRNQGREEDNTERKKSGGQFYSAHLLVATTHSRSFQWRALRAPSCSQPPAARNYRLHPELRLLI